MFISRRNDNIPLLVCTSRLCRRANCSISDMQLQYRDYLRKVLCLFWGNIRYLRINRMVGNVISTNRTFRDCSSHWNSEFYPMTPELRATLERWLISDNEVERRHAQAQPWPKSASILLSSSRPRMPPRPSAPSWPRQSAARPSQCPRRSRTGDWRFAMPASSGIPRRPGAQNADV